MVAFHYEFIYYTLCENLSSPGFFKDPPPPRTETQSGGSNSKVSKAGQYFSKSRDTREDRGAGRMKTSRKAQTFPHVR